MSSRKVGIVLREDLNLKTDRDATHGGRYAAQWDQRRIEGLRHRYGIDEGRMVELLETYFEIEALEKEAEEGAEEQSELAL